MKKIFSFVLVAVAMMAVGTVVSGCSGEDTEQESAPVESEFSKLVRTKPVHQLSYSQRMGEGFFYLTSNPIEGNYKTDYYGISVIVDKAPRDDVWNGRYEIEQAGASVWGWKEQWMNEIRKCDLGTGSNTQPVKGAWIDVRTLDKGDKYGRKTYRISLHIDMMTEENGAYAKDINVSFTGKNMGAMLVD